MNTEAGASLITPGEAGATPTEEAKDEAPATETTEADTTPETGGDTEGDGDTGGEEPDTMEDASLVFGKYKDLDAARDAFKQLESENGKLRREKAPEAPEEYSYDFSADEDLKEIIPEDYSFTEDPLIQAMEPVFKEHNFTQDQVASATKAFLQWQASEMPDAKVEMEALGDDASKLITGAQDLVSGLSEEATAELEAFATTAGAVKALNEVVAKYSAVEKELAATKKIPTGEAANSPVKSSSELYAEAKTIRNSKNFQYDSDAQAIYDKKMDQAIAAEEKGY